MESLLSKEDNNTSTPPVVPLLRENNARIALHSNLEAALSTIYYMHEKSKKQLIFSKLEIRAREQITQSSLLILYKQPILSYFPSL